MGQGQGQINIISYFGYANICKANILTLSRLSWATKNS